VNTLCSRRKFLGSALKLTVLALGGCAPRAISVSPRRPGTFSFLFYTDLHLSNDPGILSTLQQSIEPINSHHYDFSICGGDLISEGLLIDRPEAMKRWDEYIRYKSALIGESFPVIGNHDLFYTDLLSTPSGKELFLDQTGLSRTFYSFDALGVHFLMLDSVAFDPLTRDYQGAIPSEQIEWIKQELASLPRSKPIVVVTHLPLLSVRYQVSDGATSRTPPNRIVVNNREVLELFRNHNLALVLQGHMHVYEEIRWGNTLFVTGGAISGAWWKGDWMGTPPGFAMVTLQNEQYRSKYFPLS
jgi:Icc protein